MKTLLTTALVGITALLTACQSTSTAPVIARADSTYETTGTGSTKTKATEAALAAAKKQCGVRTPIVISDTVNYNGVLDEKTGRVIEQGASVIGAVFGTKTPSLSRDDDYEYQIKFQCK
ncbi:MAG: hypothetical protein Q4G13_06960 [Moraxella sp.]|nr:hypothetical protein [Moraxella sp.]